MITVGVVCYKYKPLKNGELPIKIRICKDRKTRYVNLGVSTKSEYWDFSKNQPKANCPDKELIEKLIANRINKIRSQIVELNADDKEFTATSLVQKVSNKSKPVSVQEVFMEHLKYLMEMKRTGYMLSIKQTFNSLLEFCPSLDIPFSDMDVIWLRRYETWLRKRGISENTIGIRFRNLRMIYNLAIERGIAKREYYPFSCYKVSKLHQATAKRAIQKEEIKAIINHPVKDKDFYTILAINLFTFSYFMGGINFVDMAYLTDKNLIEGRLIYRRRKTGKLINLPMQERTLLILKEYSGKNKPYLFPILSPSHKTEQQKLNRLHKVISHVNKSLKIIGDELNIPVKLTTYVARHSYATVLKRAGVTTAIISESLGHSSEKVTQIYLDSFENKHIDEAMQYLL